MLVKAEAVYRRELAERVGRAFKQFNANQPRGGELSQGELGAQVANRLGLSEPITQSAVSRWMSPKEEPMIDPRTIEAIARVLDCEPAWLAWGELADQPEKPSMGRPLLTDVPEDARSQRKA